MVARPAGPDPLSPLPLARWFGPPELEATGLRWARRAYHMQHGMARGGLLYLTDDRLGFTPKGIDAMFGARPVSWPLSTMTDVVLKPKLRRLHVRVTTDSGRQRFVVSDAAVVYNDLRAWQSAGQPAGPVWTQPEERGGAPA